MIHLAEFLSNLDNFKKNRILVFRTEQYSVLFFSLILQLFKSTFNFKIIDGNIDNLDNLITQSQASFLSIKQDYWINLSGINNKNELQKWFDFIINNGNSSFCVVSNNVELANSKMVIIDVPEYINLELYALLYKIIYKDSNYNADFVKNIFNSYSKLCLDDAIKSMHYSFLLGKNSGDLIDNWFKKILDQDYSLFLLSQYFFAKQEKQFLLYWFTIKYVYAEEFWIAFWAEQIWQSIVFIRTINKQGLNEAKKGISKLPFSFIKKDWKLHKLEDLLYAHNSLYNLDYYMKNGKINDFVLDLWYLKFFKKGSRAR